MLHQNSEFSLSNRRPFRADLSRVLDANFNPCRLDERSTLTGVHANEGEDLRKTEWARGYSVPKMKPDSSTSGRATPTNEADLVQYGLVGISTRAGATNPRSRVGLATLSRVD